MRASPVGFPPLVTKVPRDWGGVGWTLGERQKRTLFLTGPGVMSLQLQFSSWDPKQMPSCWQPDHLGCAHTPTKSAVHATMRPHYWATVIAWPKLEKTWLSTRLAMHMKKRGGSMIMPVRARRLSEEMPSCSSVTSSPWPPRSCYLGVSVSVSSTSADLVCPSDTQRGFWEQNVLGK